MRRTTPLRALVLAGVSLAILATAFQARTAEARAWLGVYTQQITSDLRQGLDLQGDGVLVARVVTGSPAERAGLRKGDVIVQFAAHDVSSPERLSELVADASSDQSVALVVIRDGQRRTLSARLGARPDESAPDATGDDESGGREDRIAPPAHERRIEIRIPDSPDAPDAPEAPGSPHVRTFRWDGKGEMPEELRGLMGQLHGEGGLEGMHGLNGMRDIVVSTSGRGRLGVRIETLNEDLAAALNVRGTKGVLVLEVLEGTPAEKAGMKAGDVVTSVGGRTVDDAAALVSALRDKDGVVSLSVTRQGVRRTVQATLQDTPRATPMRTGEGQLGQGRTGDRKVYRFRTEGGADSGELRQELDELREQLRELRQRLDESHR